MSRIDPVQKPARRGGRHVAVEPRAKQPEAQSRLVLDLEIVARRAALFAPPGAFDALGSFGTNDFVQGAAPAEAHRRAVWHERENVGDGLGFGEQTQRACAQPSRGAEAAKDIPAEFGARHGLCRHGRGGEFGNVAVAGEEPRNAPPSEPRAQPIDQAVELGLIFARAETDLLVRESFGVEYRKPRQIEAEARIDLVAERGKPLDEQRADRLRVSHGTRRARCDAFDHAIGAKESKLEPPCSLAVRRQRRLEAAREPLDAREHVLLARDRLVKAFLRHIRRDRQTRAQRLVFAAERAIELAQEIGAEAGGERRARQTENVADAFQADARQRGDRLLRQPKRWERQWRKTFARIETCIAWRPDFAEARHRVIRARTSSQRFSSPPKRCAQPPMSSKMPSGGSRATSGV